MDKFPVLFGGKCSVGELTVDCKGCYTDFTAQIYLSKDGLWCLWAIGDKGELRLGVLEPKDGNAFLRKRFSDQLVLPIGEVVRGEIYPVGEGSYEWEPVTSVEQVFTSAWLRKRLCRQDGMLRKRCGSGQYIAIPHDKGSEFTVIDLFCFARFKSIAERSYLMLCFDEEERVVFGPDETVF